MDSDARGSRSALATQRRLSFGSSGSSTSGGRSHVKLATFQCGGSTIWNHYEFDGQFLNPISVVVTGPLTGNKRVQRSKINGVSSDSEDGDLSDVPFMKRTRTPSPLNYSYDKFSTGDSLSDSTDTALEKVDNFEDGGGDSNFGHVPEGDMQSQRRKSGGERLRTDETQGNSQSHSYLAIDGTEGCDVSKGGDRFQTCDRDDERQSSFNGDGHISSGDENRSESSHESHEHWERSEVDSRQPSDEDPDDVRHSNGQDDNDSDIEVESDDDSEGDDARSETMPHDPVSEEQPAAICRIC